MKNLFNVVAVILNAANSAALAARKVIKAEKDTFIQFGKDAHRGYTHSRLPGILSSVDKEWKFTKLLDTVKTDLTNELLGQRGPNRVTGEAREEVSLTVDTGPEQENDEYQEQPVAAEVVSTQPMAPPLPSRHAGPPPRWLTAAEAATTPVQMTATAPLQPAVPPIKFGRLS